MNERSSIDILVRASAVTVAGFDLYRLSFSPDIWLAVALLLVSMLPFVLMHFLHKWRAPKGAIAFFMLPLNCAVILGLKIWAFDELLCAFGTVSRCGDQAGTAVMFISPGLLVISLPLMLLYFFTSEKRAG